MQDLDFYVRKERIVCSHADYVPDAGTCCANSANDPDKNDPFLESCSRTYRTTRNFVFDGFNWTCTSSLDDVTQFDNPRKTIRRETIEASRSEPILCCHAAKTGDANVLEHCLRGQQEQVEFTKI